MKPASRNIVKTGGGVDIAFAVVVLASYFATFSAIPQVTVADIFLMIILGCGYIAIGTYGYRFCAQSGRLPLLLAYFAIQIPLGGLIVYLGKGAGFNALILLPLAAHSVVLLAGIWMVVVNTAIILAYVISMLLFTSDPATIWSGMPTFLAGQVFIVFFTHLAVSEQSARTEVERLVSELEDANQRLRRYALQIEELAITKERNRLAREIHDGLGHHLTTIYMQIQAAIAVMDTNPQRTRAILTKAQNQTQAALVDVRDSVASLRSLPDEHLPLPERLGNLLKGSELAGISPKLTIMGTPRDLSPQAQLTIFRAVQEGLSNAVKHAQATSVWVTLDYTPEHAVQLTIRDNGVGAEQMDKGFGLMGLRERVNLLKGNFNISTQKGQGFSIKIEVPE